MSVRDKSYDRMKKYNYRMGFSSFRSYSIRKSAYLNAFLLSEDNQSSR